MVLYAAVIQRLVYQPSKLGTRVRFPFAAPPYPFSWDMEKSPMRCMKSFILDFTPSIETNGNLNRWCKSFLSNKIINDHEKYA